MGLRISKVAPPRSQRLAPTSAAQPATATSTASTTRPAANAAPALSLPPVPAASLPRAKPAGAIASNAVQLRADVLRGDDLATRASKLSSQGPLEVRATIASQLDQARAAQAPFVAVREGDRARVPVTQVVPGQRRISYDSVRDKAKAMVQTGGAFEAPVVRLRDDRLLLIDKNHNTAAAIALGATELSVHVVADLSDRSDDELRETLERSGWLFLAEPGGGEPASPTLLDHGSLTDDPLRGLLGSLALKIDPDEDGQLRVPPPKPAPTGYSAWVKVRGGRTVPFVEFYLADALYRAEQRDPSRADAHRSADPKVQVRAVRETLTAAAARGELAPDALGIVLLPADEKLRPGQHKGAKGRLQARLDALASST